MKKTQNFPIDWLYWTLTQIISKQLFKRERPLLLRILHQLLPNEQALPPPNLIHPPLGPVLRVQNKINLKFKKKIFLCY